MALSVLAEAYRAIGDFKTAEEYFEIALTLAPNVVGIGVRLATNRLDAGRSEAAIEELERLTARFPDLLDAWVQLARVHVKTGNQTEAIAVVKTMLERFPDNAVVHNIAGSSYLAAGDMDNAKIQLRLAEQIDDEALLPKLNLARLAKMRNELASAEAQYRSTLERFPHSTTANIELATLLANAGNHEEALQRVTEILRIEPLFLQAHELKLRLIESVEVEPERVRDAVYELVTAFPADPRAELVAGKVYRRLREYEDARVHLRRGVEKADFEADVLFSIANQQYGITDMSGALWSLTKAEQGSPGNQRVGVLKAAVLTELREFEKAEETIDGLVEKHGPQAEIHTVRGDWFMAQGKPVDAAQAYRAAHELAPQFRTTQTTFRALVAADQNDAAVTFINEWISAHPKHLGAKHLYAQMLMKEDKHAQAQQIYEELQAAGIEDTVLLNNLAMCYQQANDPRALPTAEAAYDKSPDDPRVVDTYGWILTEHGQVEEGLAMLRDAFARASTSPEIRFHIGLALARLGRNKEASEEVEAALAADQQFSAREDATSLLERLRAALK
jgi:putative PEP-CTERM system TPR-repeat lipoprotein